MNKDWRILSGILAFFLIGVYVLNSIIVGNWTDSILVLALVVLFGMYAWRGNNWALKFFFGNLNKKYDGTDSSLSIDYGKLKNLFSRKKGKKNGKKNGDGSI
ncbi:MAG: hypothetical protein APR62_04025 [Smithella sp. SDB]|nr:MAG: hypothetical protein APR62_04025 [Smithella sp. SDB]